MTEVERQIEHYRRIVRNGLARRFHFYLLGVALVVLVVGIVLWHPVPVLIAAFLGLIGISERKAGPNIETAIRAFDSIAPTEGLVQLKELSSDSGNQYRATVGIGESETWEFDFISQLWRPAEGTFAAKIWLPDNHHGPALVATENGIMIPRSAARKLHRT